MASRLARIGIAAALLGSLPALLLADGGRLSLRFWLAAAGAWMAFLVLDSVLRTARPASPRGRSILSRLRPRVELDDPRPRSLQALHGTVLNSRDNGRAFALRLRPRLLDVAEHQLAVNHGIDLRNEPDRARALLGDLFGLLDPDAPAEPAEPQRLIALLDALERTGSSDALGHPPPTSPDLRSTPDSSRT